MSNTLCEFENIHRYRVMPGNNGSNMLVVATVQVEYGNSVQFTIGMDYCVLSEPQVRMLISILQKRLKCSKGYAATDHEVKRYCPVVRPAR